MDQKSLYLSVSPHICRQGNIPRIMWGVMLSLTPAALMGVYLFGLRALWVILISMAVAMLTEAGIQKLRQRPVTALDGSAAITGLLLAMCLPPAIPWWAVAVGAVFSIAIGKQIYGGLGDNPFNPALLGRVMLLLAWPVQMTTWVLPTPLFSPAVDAVSAATPLGILKMEGAAQAAQINWWNLVFGFHGGCLGEVSILALLLGAGYLLWRGSVSWHIPVSFLATVFIFSSIFWRLDPGRYAHPAFHLLSGGLILGAFFMATDYVTSPVTHKGMLIFGMGCGLLTIIIRLFGGYPEGVSFAILLMNLVTPIIDRYVKPVTFGTAKK